MSDKEGHIDTGPGQGSSPTGLPAGGGAMGGQGHDPFTPAPPTEVLDADAGLVFGQGQSTSTGTLPTQGGPNLDGTGQGTTVGTDTARGGSAPYTAGVSDYGDSSTEEERRDRHGGTDKTDLEGPEADDPEA
jgi:hypothetical protein